MVISMYVYMSHIPSPSHVCILKVMFLCEGTSCITGWYRVIFSLELKPRHVTLKWLHGKSADSKSRVAFWPLSKLRVVEGSDLYILVKEVEK